MSLPPKHKNAAAGRASSWLADWRQAADRGRWLLYYHRPAQFVRRAASMARRSRLRRRRGGKYARAPAAIAPLRNAPALRRWLEHRIAEREGAAEAARQVLAGRFCFLNEPRELLPPVDWRLERHSDAPHLWRFQLHYHEFLLDFAAGADDANGIAKAWELVAQWVEANPPSDPRVYDDAWHPFCISRRLPVWMLLWTAAPPPESIATKGAASMVLQARFLVDHLEWDLGGNHLLENAKALALAGAFFDGPEANRWLDRAERILQRELPEQVLPHGEHFERSPMYHAQMLAAVLDVRDACRDVRPALSALCNEYAERMAAFLEAILHPDGDIPLLGDSSLRETPPVGKLLKRAGVGTKRGADAAEVAAQRIGPYWAWRDGGDFLLFDAGPVGADHLPAHAHADLLTIEASLAGRRLIVDAGVFNYEDDALRRYCRGTAAHNVLQVDQEDQCDLWSRFRMGRRGHPSPLAVGETADFHWARASHNAYRYRGVPRVTRWIAARPGGPWICLDAAAGRGARRLINRLHVAPGTEAEVAGPGKVRLTRAGRRYELTFLSPGEVRVSSGWYCPRFGVRLPAPVVEWTVHTNLPHVTGWSLSWQGEGQVVLNNAGGAPSLIWREGDHAIRIENPLEIEPC